MNPEAPQPPAETDIFFDSGPNPQPAAPEPSAPIRCVGRVVDADFQAVSIAGQAPDWVALMWVIRIVAPTEQAEGVVVHASLMSHRDPSSLLLTAAECQLAGLATEAIFKGNVCDALKGRYIAFQWTPPDPLASPPVKEKVVILGQPAEDEQAAVQADRARWLALAAESAGGSSKPRPNGKGKGKKKGPH